MREKVKDKGRLEHILQTCNDLLASKDKYTFDAVKDNPIIFYGFVKLSEIIGEPTLKSKACLKCLYFTKIISDLCRCLEYFFVSFLFYHDRVAHARTMCGVVYSHAHHRVGTAIIKKPFGVMIH